MGACPSQLREASLGPVPFRPPCGRSPLGEGATATRPDGAIRELERSPPPRATTGANLVESRTNLAPPEGPGTQTPIPSKRVSLVA